MPDKKNIVIKVKYPAPGKTDERNSASPGMVTEWNYKRIGLALGSVLLGLLLLFYFTDSDDKADDPLVASSVPVKPTVTNAQPIENNLSRPMPIPAAGMGGAVVRSQLTSDINKNEPVDTIAEPLRIGKKETIWLYYFAEIKGLKGKTITHEWLLNGDLVSQKKVNISADPWRTASKQMITYTINNDWTVRLVDNAGNKLIEKNFNLELK